MAMFFDASDLKKMLTDPKNGELYKIIGSNLKELQDLRESVKQLEAPGKTREAVIRELMEQLSLILQSCKNSTADIKKELEKSDKLRQNMFSSQLATLDEREKKVSEAEAEMRKGFPKLKKQALDALTATEEELRKLTVTLGSCIRDVTGLRDEYTRELSKDVMERLSRQAAEIDAKAKELREERMAEIQEEIDALQKEAREHHRQALQEKEKVDQEKLENDHQRNLLEIEIEEYKSAQKNFADEVERRIKEATEVQQVELASLRSQLEGYSNLQEELAKSKRLLARIEATLGAEESELERNPATLLDKFKTTQGKLRRVEEELASRPSIEEFRSYKQKYEMLKQDKDEVDKREQEVDKREKEVNARSLENNKLRAELTSLKNHEETVRDLQNELNITRDMLRRYQTNEEELRKTKEECYAYIEADENCPSSRPAKKDKEEDDYYKKIAEASKEEISWLDTIHRKMEQSGFLFNKRLLYAFHTALKNNEWSPLTVLAGVSGTGKSELSRLYCTYGGLNYHMVSVESNWDSPESLLGFYNSLDNKFEAQPLTHFLAHCSAMKDPKSGFTDEVNLVLLDEMNLAHVELYFSEFLSKFEQRRGTTSKNLPKLRLKLASGVPPYEIPISRNVLWAGTMNQDETTKALSDKVLDRSSCLYFPRPLELRNREMLVPIMDCGYRIPLKTWGNWKVTKISPELMASLNPYKKTMEEINDALGNIGRAVGHRVWQSISYYMAGYPTVREHFSSTNSTVKKHSPSTASRLNEELQKAFEDQLVQKVMPKLRGIETRGRGRKDCLDVIQRIISDKASALESDFGKALQFGQGQFLWLSADYLEDKAASPETK